MASVFVLIFVFGFVILMTTTSEKKLNPHFKVKRDSTELEVLKTWQTDELKREQMYKSQKIQWVKFVELDRTKLKYFVPGGNEIVGNRNFLYYVARSTHLGGIVIGKYCPFLKIMSYGYNGTEHNKIIDFEILSFPIGTLSWTPTTVDNVPAEENLVFGGIAPIFGEITYICRIVNDRHLIIGKFLPESDSRGCIYSFYGKEFKRNSFEILMINEMGKMMGINS